VPITTNVVNWNPDQVYNDTFNNISVLSWRSVSLVEKTGVTGENHRPVASNWQTLSHNVVSSTPHLIGIPIHNVSSDRVVVNQKLMCYIVKFYILLVMCQCTEPCASMVWYFEICVIVLSHALQNVQCMYLDMNQCSYLDMNQCTYLDMNQCTQ
jgi:hypothetical protein